MDNLQLSPSSSENDVETSLALGNGVNVSKETIVPSTPSVLNSQVLEMIDSKYRKKNGAKYVRPKTSTFNWPAVSTSTEVKSETENTMLSNVPGALYTGVSQGSTMLPRVFTAPGVSVKSEIFEPNISVGVHSMAQGGYMVPSSAYELMPTGQIASMAMGTYSQTQGETMPSSSPGLMVSKQATSGYTSISGLPSQTSGSPLPVGVQGLVPTYTGIPAPQGMINNYVNQTPVHPYHMLRL